MYEVVCEFVCVEVCFELEVECKWSKLAFPLCNVVVADHDGLGVFDNDGGSFYDNDCGDEVNGVIASNPVVLLDFLPLVFPSFKKRSNLSFWISFTREIVPLEV